MTGRLVTISATYGAGGSVIAPRVAQRLGLAFVDRLTLGKDLPSLPGEPPGEQAGDAEMEQDSARTRFLDGLALLSADWNIPAPADPDELPDRVREKLGSRLLDLLDGDGGVVLGHAAAMALGRRAGVFHVRLDGPADRRVSRGAAWEGVDERTARKHLERTDALRHRYARRLFDADPRNPALYHLVLDATALGVDAAVDLVSRAAEAAWTFRERDLTDRPDRS
jgi:cytidylate kinase